MRSLIPLVHFLLLATAAATESELGDILRDVDKFFDGVTGSPEEIYHKTEKFKILMRRSYNLGEGEHPMEKRSLNAETEFIRDEKGVFFIKDITPFTHVPVKFPMDLQIVSAENGFLYVAALESSGVFPRTRLANELVLYQVEEEGGSVREFARTETSGGYRLAYSSFENLTYILASEHEADNEKPFEGSSLYSLILSGESPSLEKIQILNISLPRDVKFWQHQNQMYLAVGTGDSSGFGKSQVLIYKWLSHNFDFIQKIDGSDVKSVTPFVIGSFMYLAVANHQDIYGNTNTDSEVFRYHLQSGKFTHFQNLKSQAVNDISHFKFSDSKSQKEVHFLAVANLFEMDEAGNLNFRVDSYLYKFQDDHFSPFQKFRLYKLHQWFPITGSRGEFLLLAICSYTVLGFQYDGWRFTQIKFDQGQPSLGNEIVSAKSFVHDQKIYLSFADKSSDNSGMNLWMVSFEHRNVLEEEYEKVEEWCKRTMSEVEADDLDGKLKELHSHIQNSSADKIVLDEADIETMETDSFDVYNAEMISDLNRLNAKVKKHRKELENLKKKMENSDLFVYYDVTGVNNIPYLNLNCPDNVCCTFENINIGTLNGKDFLSFLNNAVTLNEDITDSSLEFENIHVIHDISPLEINGHPAETLLDTENDVLLNSEFIVDGTVVIQGNLQISRDCLGLLKTEDELLMDSLRNFTGEIEVDTVRVKNLEIAGKLNGVDLESLVQNSTFNPRDSYKKLNIHNLNVKGSIIGSENSSLGERVFHISERRVNDSLSDTLEVDEIWVTSGVISGVAISDLIQTTAGKFYEKSGNLIFTHSETEFEVLEVRESVGGKSSAGDSTVDDVTIVVEGPAYLEEILDPTGRLKATEMFDHAVFLNSTVLNGKFEFSDIKTDEVAVDEINGIPVSSWVLANSEEVQVIKGMKTFLGDVTVEKSLVVKEVNGTDLQKLKEDTLLLEGDQTIPAENITFAGLVAVRATSNVTNVRKENTLTLERIKIFGSVELDTLVAGNVTVFGLVDGLEWNKTVRDSVFSKDDLVTGKKTVDGLLQVRRMQVSGTINSIPVDEFLNEGQEEAIVEVEVPHDLVLDDTLHVENLQFEGSLDSVEKSRFGTNWLLSEGDQRIEESIVFSDVELRKGAHLENEIVNNVDLKKLFRDSLKVNESVRIKRLVANNIRAKEIIVVGTVNGAKFRESVLLAKSETPQVVTGEWFFKQDLTVNGSFVVDGLVSGVNVTHLCGRKQSDEEEVVNLIVGGNVRFDQEPRIVYDVNGLNLEKFASDVWMKNEDVHLEGNVKFCSVEFHGNVTLNGLMNGMDLNELSRNYMSKTRKKIVTGNVTVRNLLIKESCRIRSANVSGNVNGIELESWSRSVLLQDEDQIITGRHHFADFATGDLFLNGTVNGLDLAKDLLRRDVQDAVVTGEKTFLSLFVTNLTLPKGGKIQGVSIEEWERRAVRTEGNFTLKGKLILNNPVFEKNLKVTGKVNGLIFDSDHILTMSGNQTITGKKIFDLGEYPEQCLRIKELVARGEISGIDVTSLIENQAYSDRDLVFTGRKSFSEVTVVGSLTVKGLFRGENLTEMCRDLANPPQPRNLTDQYRELYEEAKIISDHFKEEPFFLHHYKSVQTLTDDVVAVLPFSFGENGLISVITATELRLMEWDHFSERFVYKEDEVLTLADRVHYVTSGKTKTGSYLYMEISNVSKIFDSGRRMHISTGGTSCVANFQLPSLRKSCFFVGREWSDSTIFCNSTVHGDLQTYQTLPTIGTLQVSSFHVREDIFLAVINKERILNSVENYLVVYKFDSELQKFNVSSTLPEINPVAVSTIVYKHYHFLALAGGHLPESVDTSIVTIFRLNKENEAFIRYQSLLVDTPIDVKFSMLPTSELVLYVLSSNPTKPFIVFLYRGIRGFVEVTSGPSLYTGAGFDAFTDFANRHFVFISGFGRGQILQAGFKGNSIPP